MTTHAPGDDDVAEIRHQLYELQIEHRDLDQVIAHLSEHPPSDELLVRRLKKRKLALKDQITTLRGRLIPDIIA